MSDGRFPLIGDNARSLVKKPRPNEESQSIGGSLRQPPVFEYRRTGRRAWREVEEGDMNGKPTKTREELAAAVLALVKASSECRKVSGVVIAPVLKPKPDHANWHAAFTMQGKESVPRAAWQIGSQIADEFDLA
jgi:hypothetical protein